MRKSATKNDSKVTLPITPMLDMTFQLLFFFVANFNPADLEGQMDLALPSEAEKAAHKKDDVNPDKGADKDVEPEFPSDLTVKVRTQGGEKTKGEISDIAVRTIEGAEKSVGDIEGLKKYLKEKRETISNKETIKIQGDSRLHLRYVMEVMDACRDSGFKNISFVPPEDFAAGG